MTTASGKKGCGRNLVRIAIYVLILVVLAVIVYKIYGSAFKIWLVNQTLNGVENDILVRRPDGISEDEVTKNFQDVKNATSERRINLKELHRVLDDYQREFKNKNPSTDEVKKFLDELSKWSKVLSTFEPVSGDWLVVSGDSPITVSSVNKRA